MTTSTNEITIQGSHHEEVNFSKRILKKSSSEINLMSLLNQKSNHHHHQRIKEYEIIKELGRGAYGTVHLAKRDNDNKSKYALKILDKLFLSKNEKTDDALIERIILTMCNHPGIIKLISTFQTKNKLFFVLEYAKNKDLDFIMRKFGTLPHELALCYASEIVNTLDYLHNTMLISHNDLKPSNIMLDDNYHLKFIDFATAKIVNKKFDSALKRFIECDNYIDKEIVGTAEYCSPEMLSQKVNDYRTNDIWALGVMVYYFYHGKTPFKDGDHYKTFDKIRKGQYIINQLIPDDAKDLINKLLVVDASKRLNVSQIKQHKYFKCVNWNDVLTNKVPIPIEVLSRYSMKLSNGDSNTDFWNNVCNELNGLRHAQEYSIEKISEYLIIDNYYYAEEHTNNNNNNNCNIYSLTLKHNCNEQHTLVYEGVMVKIGIINNNIKVKLFSDKIMECWNLKRNVLDKILRLNKHIEVVIENEVLLKMTFDNKLKLTFKTTKLEAIKWYNLINQIIFA